MKTDFQDFLKEFSAEVKKYYGTRLDHIVLYGSYARGEQRDDSDVDMMIVLKDDQVNSSIEILNFGKKVYHIGWKYGHLLSILPTTTKKFNQSNIPVYYNARKEGVLVS